MIPINIREVIVEDRKDGMTVRAISKAVRVSESAIYRLFQKKRETGSIDPTYKNCGRNSEVTAEKLNDMETLILENPDITLAEIKETMQLSIQKSQISNIVRQKLGFRYKKRWCMPVNAKGRTLSHNASSGRNAKA